MRSSLAEVEFEPEFFVAPDELIQRFPIIPYSGSLVLSAAAADCANPISFVHGDHISEKKVRTFFSGLRRSVQS